MGTVIRQAIVAALACAALMPASAQAGAVQATLSPPWALGPSGGDQFNYRSSNVQTGEMTVVRVNPAGFSAGLGCGGSGGYANFAATYTAATPISRVVVSYDEAAIDPYTWINVGVRKNDGYLASRVERGVFAGSGMAVVNLREPAVGELTVWFGIQVASACPNVNGGRAIFRSVAFESA